MRKILWICLVLSVILVGCSNHNDKNTKKVEMGQAYYAGFNDESVCLVSVALENDVIVGVTLDEITYLSSEEFKGLPNTQADASFGSQTDPAHNLASKVQNDDAYSGLMKAHGAKKGIAENYQSIIDHVMGKGVEDLRQEIMGKSDDQIIDAVSGCTLLGSRTYLEAIIQACQNAK